MGTDADAAAQIDAIIAAAGDWRGDVLAQLRRVVVRADPGIVEAIKWRKPSRPEGVATWMCEGNVCMADLLKRAVRLTFPKGARIDDPAGLFNARLDSGGVRAIDWVEGAPIDDEALGALVARAVALNRAG
ncbi:MAG: DUF1801 domain-containing protein [Amnibacterium sp.]